MTDALRFQVEPDLADPVLVLAFDGWNDAGDAATGAARFLADSMHTAPLAEIDPEEYYDFTVRRPEVKIDDRGLRHVEWPAFEFRYGVLPERCELVTGFGAEPHLRWKRFCNDVVALCERVGVRRVVLLGAYLADVLYSLPVSVSGFAEPTEGLDGFVVETTQYEGPTGIVGVLGERLRHEGIPFVSLWAGLPHYISVTPNSRGTLALVQIASRLLDLPVDTVPLERAAADFETEVAQLVAADPALAEYVKQLKRREFAQ